MSTLVEIETAIRRLSLAEQQQLLSHLEKLVHRPRVDSGAQVRDHWMGRLKHLRAAIGAGSQTLTSEGILNESREERA